MVNSKNESVWGVLREARLGETGDMPFAYRVGLPDEPEIIDEVTKEIIKPRTIRMKLMTLANLLDRIEAALKRDRGNAAAMREALENSNGLLEELSVIGEWGESAREQIAENNAAISAQARNCDMYVTLHEMSMAYEAYRKAALKRYGNGLTGRVPTVKQKPMTYDEWLLATAAERKGE